MHEYHIIVSGCVQGVGYRVSVFQLANSSNLKGTVKNLPSGQVEIYVQLKENELNNFLKELHFQNSDWIKVTDISVNEVPLNHYTDFKIIY